MTIKYCPLVEILYLYKNKYNMFIISEDRYATGLKLKPCRLVMAWLLQLCVWLHLRQTLACRSPELTPLQQIYLTVINETSCYIFDGYILYFSLQTCLSYLYHGRTIQDNCILIWNNAWVYTTELSAESYIGLSKFYTSQVRSHVLGYVW